ncbi:hypothetical protein JCM12294_26400 [Desulfocicer niacini]
MFIISRTHLMPGKLIKNIIGEGIVVVSISRDVILATHPFLEFMTVNMDSCSDRSPGLTLVGYLTSGIFIYVW